MSRVVLQEDNQVLGRTGEGLDPEMGLDSQDDSDRETDNPESSCKSLGARQDRSIQE